MGLFHKLVHLISARIIIIDRHSVTVRTDIIDTLNTCQESLCFPRMNNARVSNRGTPRAAERNAMDRSATATITLQGACHGRPFMTYKWERVVRMVRLMYCCNKRRLARADLHFTFIFMVGGRGSRGHSEEVQLAGPQAGQVI